MIDVDVNEVQNQIEACLTAKGWELANDLVSVDYYDSRNFFKHADYEGFFTTDEALWLSMKQE